VGWLPRISRKARHFVRLLSLRNKNLSSDFPAIVEAVRGVVADTVLIDGEIVAVDRRGCPSFQMLQNRASLGRDWQIVYYAFDLLELDGKDWKTRPLTERKERLQQVLSGSEVRYNAELPGSPEAVVRTVREAGLEDVIAKRRDSIYRASTRTNNWVKLSWTNRRSLSLGATIPIRVHSSRFWSAITKEKNYVRRQSAPGL
jgi:bifunctional non-homologous end joining protein LigD